MVQMTLPIRIETHPPILGLPIVRTIIHDQTLVEVVDGELAGSSYVYIIHLFGKVSHAQHYIGSTNNLAARLKQHRRKWPRYQLTAADIEMLYQATIRDEDYAAISALQNKVYRRKQTFLSAAAKCLGHHLSDYDKVILLSLARKHTSNGLLMAANQRGIDWTVARVFQADRQLEFALKSQKHISRHCPICQCHDLPF